MIRWYKKRLARKRYDARRRNKAYMTIANNMQHLMDMDLSMFEHKHRSALINAMLRIADDSTTSKYKKDVDYLVELSKMSSELIEKATYAKLGL